MEGCKSESPCARRNASEQDCDLPYWAYVCISFAVGTQKPCHGLTLGRDLAQSCWMKWSAQAMNSHLTSARKVTGDNKTVTTLKMLGSPVTLSQVHTYSSVPSRCSLTAILHRWEWIRASLGGVLIAFHRWHGKAEGCLFFEYPQLSAPFGFFLLWAVEGFQKWGSACFSPLLSSGLLFSHPLQRALSGWLVVAAPAKAGWKFITTETGAQCVMTAGQTLVPRWSAGSWASGRTECL